MFDNFNHQFWGNSDAKLYCGDTLETLKTFPDETIDMVICSPPYFGLRCYLKKAHPDYTKQIGLETTFQDYLNKMLLITAEIKRVLKKTGSFWLNMGDCYGGSNQGYGAKSKSKTGIQDVNDGYYASSFDKTPLHNLTPKCLLMMPERLALGMIEQGWILRNKIKWVKQIYIHNQKRTMGSVMPTSVKDRFNESGEELYFFCKSKKYYADLDSVRLKIQTFENRPMGIERQDSYDESKYNKFNYRVRDAEKKSNQCPQFKATEEEIKNYYAPADHRGKNDTTEKNYGLKKYNTNPDPRGDDKGGPGSYRLWKDSHPYQGKSADKEDAEMFNSPRARTQRTDWQPKRIGGKVQNSLDPKINKTGGTVNRNPNYYGNPQGKNLPSCWLIGTEPHNFSKEFHCEIDHFATFPQDLVEIPIKFASPKGGIVLDPFCGSGTVGVVAQQLGRKFIGIDLNQDYLTKISIPRLEREKVLCPLI